MNTGMLGPGMAKGPQQQGMQQQPQQQPGQHPMMMGNPNMQHQGSPMQMGTHHHQQQQYQGPPQGLGPQHGMSPAMMAAQQQQQHPHVQHQQPPPSQIKDMNVSYLCRIGAEFVQDIASRTIELFQVLKSLSPQMSQQQQDERKIKVKELTKTIDLHFKRLRKIYERCSEVCASMDFVDIESLLAIKEEGDDDDDDCHDDEVDESSTIKPNVDDELMDTDVKPRILPKNGRRYIPSLSAGTITEEKKRNNPKLAKLDEEYQDLVELNKLRNRQMKEVIDRLRKLVWDINTMLAMRKP